MSISDRLDEIPTSGIRKLFDLASKYKDVISLGIGEPDFDTPDHIKQYAKEALDIGLTHYTPNNGLKVLRETISIKLRKENSMNADPDKNIMITVGGNQAFLLIMSSFIRTGDEILLLSPHFMTHSASVTLAGGIPITIDTTDESGFKPSAEDLNAKITPRTRGIMLNSPNNPTGAVLGRKELEEIADIAIEHNLKIISDEVYEALIYDGEKHVSIASLNGMAEKVITVNSFSKSYAMTGWRVGYLVADEESIYKMIKFQMYLAACPVSFAQYAAAKAITDPRSQESISIMRSEYNLRRKYIYDKLREIPGLTVAKPFGAFYIFPRIDGKDDISFSEMLLTDGHVAAVPGSAFGNAGRGHLRLAYTVSMKKLEEAMDRFEKVMQKAP